MNARYIAAALAVTAATAGMLAAFRRGFAAGLAAGYSYGETDGRRVRDAGAHLDMALAAPDEARHYAGIVSQLPGAYDSAAFAEALLNGGLREPVGEDVQR